jgi:hypothetical protein
MPSARVTTKGCAGLTNQNALSWGKTLFGVKAQAVRKVCIFEQNVYSQTIHPEEVSEVPGVGLDLDQRRSPNAVSWELRLDGVA